MSTSSVNFSEKSEYDEQLKISEFERFQRGMKDDFTKLIDEVEHFPQHKPSSSRDINALKNKQHQAHYITRQPEKPLNLGDQKPKDEANEKDQYHSLHQDTASEIETGMPHPDLDGISFHSDIDIYGDWVEEENRSSSDSWERHLDDVDEDYKLRPPRKKTSGSVISVQSVGNYFLSKSFPVSEFDDVINSQKTTESNSIDSLSEADVKLSFQALLQSRFSMLPNKLNEKTVYDNDNNNKQQEEEEETSITSEYEQTNLSQYDQSLSTPENISISEAISSSSQDQQQIPQVKKEFKYAISPESLAFECCLLNDRLAAKTISLKIYNPNIKIAINYRLDTINDLLIFSSLSGSVAKQSQAVIRVRLNTDRIRQQYKDVGNEQELQLLTDNILVFIDDMPPSELEVKIDMDLDLDVDLSDKRIRRTSGFKKEYQLQKSVHHLCCKFCSIERDVELHNE